MISFSCPACGNSYTVADDLAGKTTKCKQCRNGLTVPGKRFNAWLLILPLAILLSCGLGAVGMLVLGNLGTALPAATSVFPKSSPDTPRAMAERIKANGGDIRWAACTFELPALYLVRAREYTDPVKGAEVAPGLGFPDLPLGQYLDERRKQKIYDDPLVIVVLYPTEKEAKEQAGSTQHGFSWGRFSFFGDESLLQEIKPFVR